MTATFYAAFDNRAPRIPTGEELLALFAEQATITRVAPGDAACWDPAAFVAPRIAMLTDGTLTEFHEWETESRTAVFEDIASRWSTYEKEGSARTVPTTAAEAGSSCSSAGRTDAG